MPGYRYIKRKNNEIEYFTPVERERYYRRVLWLDAIVVIAFLLAIIIFT